MAAPYPLAQMIELIAPRLKPSLISRDNIERIVDLARGRAALAMRRLRMPAGRPVAKCGLRDPCPPPRRACRAGGIRSSRRLAPARAVLQSMDGHPIAAVAGDTGSVARVRRQRSAGAAPERTVRVLLDSSWPVRCRTSGRANRSRVPAIRSSARCWTRWACRRLTPTRRSTVLPCPPSAGAFPAVRGLAHALADDLPRLRAGPAAERDPAGRPRAGLLGPGMRMPGDGATSPHSRIVCRSTSTSPNASDRDSASRWAWPKASAAFDADDPDDTRFWDYLVETGLCLPAKRDALFDWVGGFRLGGRAGAGASELFLRTISHVKLVYQPCRAPEAKVYLAVGVRAIRHRALTTVA